jgi:hypothetical protein
VHELDFRLVRLEHITKGDQWEGHTVIKTHVFDMFYLTVIASVTYVVRGNCVLLSNRQYISSEKSASCENKRYHLRLYISARQAVRSLWPQVDG